MRLRKGAVQYVTLAVSCALTLVGCKRDTMEEITGDKPESNILLQQWQTPFGMPPFDSIPSNAYVEAYDVAAQMQNTDIAKIVMNADEPTFKNTIEPYERSRSMLYRVLRTFLAVNNGAKDSVISEAASHILPAFAAHEEAIFLDKNIFDRVNTIYQTRNDLALRRDQIRLIELIHQEFMKSGVGVAEKDKARLEEIAAEIAALAREFGENVNNESSRYELLVTDRGDLGRMPENLVDRAADRAKEKGHDCECWSFSAKEEVAEPFLQYSPNREMRKTLYHAYMSIGSNENEFYNGDILNQILALRAEKARIMGFRTFADYQTSFGMIETAENAEELIKDVYAAALGPALEDKLLLDKYMRLDGIDDEIKAWDWPYYAEAARLAEYSLNDEELRPYFSLENVQTGLFSLATKLFGLTFVQRDDLPRWHENQVTFEVLDSGQHLGVLMVDYFSRADKRSSSWTDEVRVAETMDGAISAIAAMNFHFAAPSDDKPALLNLHEAEILFHEFGHALHTLLSKQTYVRLSGFNYFPRDGVEYPSQVLEYWFNEPDFMRTFAKHYKTQEPISAELLEKIRRSSKFNKANKIARNEASSLLDLRLHQVQYGEKIDAGLIEKDVATELELPEVLGWRFRANHFRHIVTLGYPAGIYGYLYSDVLAADAFGEFLENGLFDEQTANRFRKYVFEMGSAEPPLKMFREFRGRDPSPTALLSTISDE